MKLPEEKHIRAEIDALPEALRAPAQRFFERLSESRQWQDDVPVEVLARLVAVSDFAAGVLLREWDALADRLADAEDVFDATALEEICDAVSRPETSEDEVRSFLRRERNRQLCLALWREQAGTASVADTLKTLSTIADAMLRAASRYAHACMRERNGDVRDGEGRAVGLVVLGMGKLGGGELNFSSDIDVIFAYSSDGESDGQKPLPAQKYFDRMSRAVISLMHDVTADGFVFRMDTRLRPFGESGPPVVSFSALESYLLNHGRDWERYAYVKASIVGPRTPDTVSAELLGELIRPFVYRGYLDFGVFESLRDMHRLISAEGRQRELADNVKIGPGGIREVEFIVQSLQLVRGGNRPELQTPSLLAALPRLVDNRGLDEQTAEELRTAYLFLRRVENAIQAMRDKQVHDLPFDAADRERLRLAMGWPDWSGLQRRIDEVRHVVSRHFDAVAFPDAPDEGEKESDRLGELWAQAADVSLWRDALQESGFAQVDAVAGQLVAFRNATGTAKLGSKAAERLRRFVPRLLLLARESIMPAATIGRCLKVVNAILRRSAYLSLLNENPAAAAHFVRLCGESIWIATELERFPVLLDELLDPAFDAGDFSREAFASDLAERLARRPDADVEEQAGLLAQFQRATMFRIAVADCSGGLPVMRVSDSLTWLAEVVLDAALAIAWQELVSKHGTPRFEHGGEARAAGLGIVAYGKLGGIELSYGSDLDIVFLHDSSGAEQETDGDRVVDNSIFFARLARRLVHILATRTTTGALYEIDTRLRPSGRKGLLVSTIEAFAKYQDENAWTWEHQALLRARPVAGSESLGEHFARIRRETLTTRVRQESLTKDVLEMRARMRAEVDDSDSERFNLKHGEGGIGDIEFLVQYLLLANASRHPDVIEFTDNIRQLNALADCGALSLTKATELQRIYRRYRFRQHRLALNAESSHVAAGEFLADREFVRSTWTAVFGA